MNKKCVSYDDIYDNTRWNDETTITDNNTTMMIFEFIKYIHNNRMINDRHNQSPFSSSIVKYDYNSYQRMIVILTCPEWAAAEDEDAAEEVMMMAFVEVGVPAAEEYKEQWPNAKRYDARVSFIVVLFYAAKW